MKPNIGWALSVGITMTLVAFAAPQGLAAADAISAQEANEIAVEGYIYLYPLVTMDVTRRLSTNIEAGKKPGFGPEGECRLLQECGWVAGISLRPGRAGSYPCAGAGAPPVSRDRGMTPPS